MAKKGISIGKKAPAFELDSTHGVKSLAHYQGKPLVIVFLRGTWCPNCRKQFLELNEYYERFVQKGVNLIAIVGQKLANVKQYAEHEQIKYPVFSDETREVIKAYEVFTPIKWDSFRIAIPSTYLVDSKGLIRYSYVGDSQFDRPTAQELLDVIDTLSDTPVQQGNALDELPIFLRNMQETFRHVQEAGQYATKSVENNLNNINQLTQILAGNNQQLAGFTGAYEESYEELYRSSQKLDATSGEFGKIHELNSQLSQHVQSTHDLMRELIEMTNSVHEMSRVITQISNQTKILALNASIEAARAGEHGKGFAIVAQEVTKLANGTESSAQQITTQLQLIENKIQESFSSFNGFEETMHQIGSQVSSNIEEVHTISRDMRRIAERTNDMIPQIEAIKDSQEEAQSHLHRIGQVEEKIKQDMSEIHQDMDYQLNLLKEMKNRIKTK
ncbi:redoxin domain-containing protein [Brevibacillus dissolubilis]|uniref:redoxin domain-containing protein n=1 Tax=Brevibacillus dissolubilis TaxID=1844116 RepID=UPI0011175AE1|nr:redoxin domain-containing protein [Brevibacillus dissolubilis]